MAADRVLRVRAPAKINLSLRIAGVREDGYHELRTVFQSIALHDTLVLRPNDGPLALTCSDPRCPAHRDNLVWRAAEHVWRLSGRRGTPRGFTIAITKRIPIQAGLGGGSSDAAAALRLVGASLRIAEPELRAIGARIGADVPFFFEGGTVLGLERGDLLFPLVDRDPAWVVLALPAFGVSTKEAFGWWDEEQSSVQGRPSRVPGRASTAAGRRSAAIIGNDLERVVGAHHPEVRRLVRALGRLGASEPAMSGSGSAVFGWFESRPAAERAARALIRDRVQAMVSRTVSRLAYRRLTRLERGG